MLIVADKNIPLLQETFGRHGELRLRAGRTIDRGDLDGADALLVKSITPVTRDLLAGSTVRFVGSATIGFDHLDTQWMKENGVTWTNAPGCNADAAAQYTLAMILLACRRLGRDLRGMSAGVIGRGNVGSRIQRLLESRGVGTVANDPPLADAGVEGLVSQEEALARDVVCLHVPLTRDGPYPTWQMINAETLARLPDHALLVNSSRGNVAEGGALLAEIRNGRLRAALDVWPNEPDVDPYLLEATVVATPHVAGYSEEGRRNGALMIYRAFCDWARIRADESAVPATPTHVLPAASDLAETVLAATHIEDDDQAMRRLVELDREARKSAFDALRKHYPLRSDFGAWTLAGLPSDRGAELESLGFSTRR